MARPFKVEIEVEELYELESSTSYQAFDQRDGCYTDYKVETHTFACFNDAVEWVRKNPEAEIKSFVRMENKLKTLKQHTKRGL